PTGRWLRTGAGARRIRVLLARPGRVGQAWVNRSPLWVWRAQLRACEALLELRQCRLSRAGRRIVSSCRAAHTALSDSYTPPASCPETFSAARVGEGQDGGS